MPGWATAARRSGVALPQQVALPPWLLCSAGPMTAHSGIGGPAAGLTGRRSERDVLDRFVAGVRAGEGRALVVRGEPGVGKTALLDYLTRRASGCLVARAAGVQSEMELAFAGLHQLCAPMLDHAESLPGPQRGALRTAFGLSAGAGSWLAWPCWACCPRRRENGRSCAWWMTSSGWTTPRRRRWGSPLGGWWPNRSARGRYPSRRSSRRTQGTTRRSPRPPAGRTGKAVSGPASRGPTARPLAPLGSRCFRSGPGEIELTRMPCSFPSIASWRVIPMIAALFVVWAIAGRWNECRRAWAARLYSTSIRPNSLTARSTSLAPSRANVRAAARPALPPVPVMMQTFLASRPAISVDSVSFSGPDTQVFRHPRSPLLLLLARAGWSGPLSLPGLPPRR